MRSLWETLRQAIGRSPELPIEGEPASEEGIYWGGIYLPWSEAVNHFLCVGSTGSGKTITMRLLMQSVLPSIGASNDTSAGNDARALVFDAKGDAMPLLHAICPQARIRTTSPFDARGVAWDLAADIREPRVAVEIAFILIPPTTEAQPYFADAARHILYKCILSLCLSGHDWIFADLLRALSSVKRLKSILKRHWQTRDVISRYFTDKRLLHSILSTLATKMMAFEPIAAAWEDAKDKVSLHQWAKEESILILANSDISRTAVNAINTCIFLRATQIVLAQTESFTRRNYFLLDELTEGPRFDGLVSLVKRGRSKGCAVAASLQSVAGLRDPKLYGPHFATEILGQFSNRFVGRLECGETAEWVSKSVIGDQEIDQITTSHTSSNNGNSSTRNQQIVTRRTVLPSELMDIDPCTRANGLTGYYTSRSVGCYLTHLPGDELFQDALIPPDPSVPEFVERPIEVQYLRPWTKDDAIKFGALVRKVEPREQPQRQQKQSKLDLLEGLDDLDS